MLLSDLHRAVSTTPKLRVLQLGVSLCIGGSEQLTALLCEQLDPERFEPAVAAVGIDGEIGTRLRQRGVSATAFDRVDGFDTRMFRRIWTTLRQGKFDLVQTHHLSPLIYGGLPSRLSGAKLIHTEHEIKTFQQNPRNLRWLRTLRSLVHHFVAIDPSIADYLENEAGVPASKITVIRNGIDLSRFHPASQRDRDVEFTVGWVGRLDKPKRPDVFVDAIQRLASDHPNLRGVMVGPGELLESTRERVAKAELGARIQILGGRSDISELMQQFDCYVLCSDAEGLPISLVEAMATGLPCIASAVGGIPRVIKQGTNGFLLHSEPVSELANCLQQLMADPKRRETLAHEARQTAMQHFDIRNTVLQYAELYQDLCKGNRKR